MNWNKWINNTINIVLFLLIIIMFDTYGIVGGVVFITILFVWFTYRIWFNKNDLMYQAREQLETVLAGKPFNSHIKGEKIKLKKFGGWK